MRFPQRQLDACGGCMAGENEAQISRSLRKRDDLLPKWNGDPDILNALNLSGILLARDLS
jgi:hypothetical protein